MTTTYIAFLRAINVGGHNVKMEHLRELFGELGFNNVRTYIQTGNVFFETSETDRDKLTKKIEDHLVQFLGYEVTTFLRTIPELEHALNVAPFKTIEPTEDTRHCIVFISRPLEKSVTFPLISPKKDMEILGATDSEAFVKWYIINGRPPSSGTFLDKALGKSTSRFYSTAIKILEAAKNG